MDCKQSQPLDIRVTPQGYLIEATGEVLAYIDPRIKKSKDEFYHRCAHPASDPATTHTICLYVPQGAF